MTAIPSTLVLAEKSVPRYTSYPTAPHFSDAVGPDQSARMARRPCRSTRASRFTSTCLFAASCAPIAAATPRPRARTARSTPMPRPFRAKSRSSPGLRPAREVVHAHWGGGTPGLAGRRPAARAHRLLARPFQFFCPRPKFRSNSTRVMSTAISPLRLPGRRSTASASACRISIRMCRRPLAASSPSRLSSAR